jgi:hypothetical protein
MSERDIILTEIKSISDLVSSIPNVNVYKVHPNYFDGLRAELQARIIASNFYTVENKMEVPVGYFENLTSSILQKIQTASKNDESEIEKLSPTIAAIGNANIYTVPQGYFEKLNVKKQIAPVVKMGKMNIFKYAAAAVVVGILSLSIYTFIHKTTNSNDSAAIVKAGNDILQKGTFDKELETLTDKDLENYLSSNGENVATALVASTIDDDIKLPDAADYFFDDNTLDKFLIENNLKN